MQNTKEVPRPKLGLLPKLFLALIIIGALFYALSGFITDILWFKELGYLSVFFKQLFTQLKIGIPVFIVVTLLVYIYFKMLKKGYYKRIESNAPDRSKGVNKITWVIAIVYSLFVTVFSVQDLWFDALQFYHSTDFGISDPIFNLDISFYVFKLEFLQNLNNIVIISLLGLLVVTAVYYVVLVSARAPQIFEKVDEEQDNPFAEEDDFAEDKDDAFDENPFQGGLGGIFAKMEKNAKAKKRPSRKSDVTFDKENFHELLTIAKHQLIIVGIVLFLNIAVAFLFKQFSLLYTHYGVVYGAGFTEVNITLWVYRILMVLAVVGAITFGIGVTKKKFKTIVLIPIIMIIVGAVGYGGAALVQNFVVSPDEISKESQYLEYNIEFTQYAYGLSDVTVNTFAADNSLTSEDIQNNDATISNIRINDYDPTETFYNQTQSIRQYYTFSDVDVDRYVVNGDYSQTFLSVREIDEEKISNTWINVHLKYTHGYGVTMSQVDQVTASGQPDVIVGNIPPVSSVEEINITRPEVYFGEQTNNYIIVGTKEEEFDYPDGDNNQYTLYEGTAGIKLNPINRVLFAIREHSLKLLVSSNINGDSRIVINRNVMDRVQTIMPYLSYENDPYMCTVDGKLYWIVDAYTTSSRFPYSEQYSDDSDVNYIRNSIKVVVDAYNGTVDYYIVDESDPIAQTYASIYPTLFKDLSDMPEELQAHLRYPNAMFEIQANVYKKYHMEDVRVFYQNEDLWDIANEIYGTEEVAMTPNYYIMNLPGTTEAEFVNTIPYTPRDKKNMTALLVARNDGEHYGELVLYQMPKSKVVYGPMQVEAMIDQNTEISKEFSLWNSSGSTYSRGNMFVIPIEDSLLYVEPVYLEATNSSIPEVKRVIVVYGDRIAYESTLAECLNVLFGDGAGDGYSNGNATDSPDGGDGTLTQDEIIDLCQEEYDKAIECQTQGDWAGYGEHMDELEKYLNML